MRDGSEAAAVCEGSQTNQCQADRGELEGPDGQCEPPARLIATSMTL
jgi:hypothetical protein